MRLDGQQKKAIIDAVKGLDREARIILFGSRVDDNARGGDFDLLVVSDKLGLRDEWVIRRDILDQMGWQKLDLIIARRDQLSSGIAQLALEQGVALDQGN